MWAVNLALPLILALSESCLGRALSPPPLWRRRIGGPGGPGPHEALFFAAGVASLSIGYDRHPLLSRLRVPRDGRTIENRERCTLLTESDDLRSSCVQIG